jgi:DNA repair protein RadC
MCSEDRDSGRKMYFDKSLILFMRNISIRNWSADDQPREKLLQRGAHTLSNAELLAILINNGTSSQSALDIARTLLNHAENDILKLSAYSVKELVQKKIAGLGTAKAVTIAAALELGIRRNAAAGGRKEIVNRSGDIADYLRAAFEYRKQEVFAVVYLNRGNRVVHTEIISEGGLTGTVVDPRIIFKKALENNATALILCHNHPSGNLRPSSADEMITRRIREGALLLDIRVMDHIIVSTEGYFSFADEGLL